MSRGHPPRVAIAEAKRHAVNQGYAVIGRPEPGLPYDFMISRDNYVTVVRVRRLRLRGTDKGGVLDCCADEIRELRTGHFPVRFIRELWVRGPGRTWSRYRVKADEIRRLGCWEVEVTGPQVPIDE